MVQLRLFLFLWYLRFPRDQELVPYLALNYQASHLHTLLPTAKMNQEEWEKKKKKEIVLSIFHRILQLFSSQHTKSHCVPLHAVAVCIFPKHRHCELSEDYWQLSHLDHLVQIHHENQWGNVRGKLLADGCISQNGATLTTSKIRIPAQLQPCEVGRAEHQRLVTGLSRTPSRAALLRGL